MDAVLELLNKLASQGIKLSIEGDDLKCYAQKGLLTAEIRDCIVQHKPGILDILGGYKRFQSAPTLSDMRNEPSRGRELTRQGDKNKVAPTRALLDLGAEAVLDVGIQPSAAGDDSVDS